jgi:hypothetical protein
MQGRKLQPVRHLVRQPALDLRDLLDRPELLLEQRQVQPAQMLEWSGSSTWARRTDPRERKLST